MNEIDPGGSALIDGLERRLQEEQLDISEYAIERDKRLGSPNFFSSVFIPFFSILFRTDRSLRSRLNKVQSER